MAIVYVSPGLATGNNDGTTAADAFRTWAAFATAGCAAASDVRVNADENSTDACNLTSNVNGTNAGYTTITGYSTDWATPTVRFRNGSGAGADIDGLTLNAISYVEFSHIQIKNYTRDGIRIVTAAANYNIFNNCIFNLNSIAGFNSSVVTATLSYFYNCYFGENGTYGFVGASSSTATLYNCKLKNNTTTNYLCACQSNRMINCISIGSVTAIVLNTASNIIIDGSIIDSATTGLTGTTTNIQNVLSNSLISNCTKAIGITSGNIVIINLSRYNNTNADTVTTGSITTISGQTLLSDPYVDQASGNYALKNTVTERWVSTGIGTETNTVFGMTAGLTPIPDFPAVSNVAPDDTVDLATGTMDLPSITSVDPLDTLRGVSGEMDLPSIANVLDTDTLRGVAGEYDSNKILTLVDEAARNTDPGVANVKIGEDYKIQNVDKTGTYNVVYPVPDAPVLSYVVNSDVAITLTWTPGTLVAYYRLFYKSVGGVYAQYGGDLEVVSQQVIGLTPEASYTFKVIAYNDGGNSTSNEVTATTLSTASVPSYTSLGQLIQSIRTAILEISDGGIDTFSSDNVVVGEITDFSNRTSDGYPCVEIIYGGRGGSGDTYISQRLITGTYSFRIFLHTYVTTADRENGNDIASLTKYGSAIMRQLFRMTDSASGNNPPCDGFVMTKPNFTLTPAYEAFSTNVNTEIIEVDFRVDFQDTEI